MSLLMDALKKAEREKNKAAKKDKETAESTSEHVDSETVSTDSSDEKVSAEEAPTEPVTKDENSDTWAFDTGELELEPMPDKLETPPENEVPLGDDQTLAESLPPLDAQLEASDESQSENTETIKSEFDHDATLPSERAIQSSLKDYFEASQSITMDQASISGPLSQNTSEHSFTNNTSPLDSSATHVTAHTIFTASQTRQASTGLLKYAIFGTLFLALGLGAVALYYSAMTPNVSENSPIAAIDPVVTQSTDVDDKQPAAPFEPDVGLDLNTEDPVVAGVVNAEKREIEELNADMDSLASIAPATEGKIAKDNQTKASQDDIKKVVQTKASIEKQKPAKKAQSESAVISSAGGDGALEFNTNKVKPQSDETNFLQTIQSETTTAKKEQRQQPTASYQEQGPIEVMPAKDFSEALAMPKSAIKITRGSGGNSRGVRNSDVMNAYQAYQAGDYIKAKAEYRKILNSRPDNRDARLGLAAIAVQEGRRETASGHYQYLLQQNPKDEVVNAAIFSLHGNALDNVNESQLKLMLDQSPNSPQLHFSLGSYYAKQSRWAEAQQAFFDAFAADKTNADYAYNLAVSLEQIGQTKSALSYYRQALKLADKNRVSFNTSRVLARIQKLSGLAVH